MGRVNDPVNELCPPHTKVLFGREDLGYLRVVGKLVLSVHSSLL